MNSKRARRSRFGRTWPILAACALAIAALGSVVLFYHSPDQPRTTTSGPTSSTFKYAILYIDQGNGVVDQSNFGTMLSFAVSQGFNTVFFQVYREGSLLFDQDQLSLFVVQAHGSGMKTFFSLYFTNDSQSIPTSIYTLGEDGISLDMSSLSVADQSSLFASLRQGYTSGQTAITTTDLALPLSPDLLVLETYGADIQQFSAYIHPGVIASVGVFDTTSRSNYEQEYQYALSESDGVMVFDYSGLMKSGY